MATAIYAGGLPKPPDVFTIIKNKALNKKVVSHFVNRETILINFLQDLVSYLFFFCKMKII